VGQKAKGLLHVIEEAATVILKITTYVMMFAPFAIFAAIAGTISTQGLGIPLHAGAEKFYKEKGLIK